MKILIVNKFLHPNGGSETYIFGLGEQFKKMGHAVEYFGMEHEGRIVGNRAESYTADMDFHAGGLRKLTYPLKLIYSVEARKKLRPVLQDFAPDAVHLNNINFQLTPSILYEIRAFEKKKGKKIKIVYTAHDSQWVCPNHLMMIPSTRELCFACRGGNFGACSKNRCIHNSRVRSILGTLEAQYYKRRKTYGMVDAIICPSEFMKSRLDTNPLLADKTLVMHNFVDLPAEEETHRRAEDTEGKTSGMAATSTPDRAVWEALKTKLPERYALYFGRYSEEKGVETLLRVCKDMTDVSFVFAGKGPLEEEVSKVSNIRNVGFVSGMALRKLTEQAAFCIYPSECYENCPFSIMEAQCCGTPVIAAAIGGIPELIEDGATGELFPAGDKEALQEKIRKLWNQSKLCETYRENCKKIKYDTTLEYCGKIIGQVYS